MYADRNFKTKKAFKEAVQNGQTVTLFQDGPFGGTVAVYDGTFSVEGPHYPEPHKWYAQATVKDGKVIKVK